MSRSPKSLHSPNFRGVIMLIEGGKFRFWTANGWAICQWKKKYPKGHHLFKFKPNVFSYIGKWLSHLRFKIWIFSKKGVHNFCLPYPLKSFPLAMQPFRNWREEFRGKLSRFNLTVQIISHLLSIYLSCHPGFLVSLMTYLTIALLRLHIMGVYFLMLETSLKVGHI